MAEPSPILVTTAIAIKNMPTIIKAVCKSLSPNGKKTAVPKKKPK